MTLKTLYNDFYGDETRWWVGVVQSIDDPLEQGRVRVRIFGVHSASEDDIPNSARPWAQVVAPITHGGTSGINGTPVGIKPYAQAFGIFLDGKHSQLPLVLGSIPKIDGPNPTLGGRGGDPRLYGATGAGGGADGGGNVVPVNPDAADPRGEAERTNPGVRAPGSSAPAGNTSRRLRGGTPVEQIYNYLESYFRTELRLGNSKELAAGFAGNFDAESIGGQFDIENGLGFRGIAQWDKKDRGPKMNRFATARGGQLYPTRLHPSGEVGKGMVPDLAMQLDWVIHELTTVKWLRFDKIKAEGTTPERAADRVEAYYEISEFSTGYGGRMPNGKIYKYGTYEQRQARGKPKLGAYQKRINFAREIYNEFAIKRSSAE
jgi:hypothetical protein